MQYSDQRVTAPSNAAYLYMNMYNVYGNGSLYRTLSIHATRLGNHYLDKISDNEFLERNNKVIEITNF